MRKYALTFFTVGISFFIWSLLGPILNTSSFTPLQTIWGQSIFACIYILIYAYATKNLKELKKIKQNKLLIVFLISSSFSGVLWLQSLTMLPIAQAVLLYSVVPLFTFIFSLFFFRERFNGILAFALILGFMGVLSILTPDLGSFSIKGKLLGSITVLLAASLTSIQTIIAKKFHINYPVWITIFLIMAAQTIVALPFAFAHVWQFTPFAITSTLFLSFFSAIIAFFFYVNALHLLSASTVTLVGYIEPVFATVWGYTFLHQQLTFNIFIGGALILVAGYLTIRSEERMEQKAKAT